MRQRWRKPELTTLGRQRQADLREFEASLVYRVSSRTAEATQRNPVSKTKGLALVFRDPRNSYRIGVFQGSCAAQRRVCVLTALSMLSVLFTVSNLFQHHLVTSNVYLCIIFPRSLSLAPSFSHWGEFTILISMEIQSVSREREGWMGEEQSGRGV